MPLEGISFDECYKVIVYIGRIEKENFACHEMATRRDERESEIRLYNVDCVDNRCGNEIKFYSS